MSMLKYIVSVIVVFNFICLSSSAFFVIAFDKVMKELNFSLYLIKLLICEMLTPVIQAVDGQTVWLFEFCQDQISKPLGAFSLPHLFTLFTRSFYVQ